MSYCLLVYYQKGQFSWLHIIMKFIWGYLTDPSASRVITKRGVKGALRGLACPWVPPVVLFSWLLPWTMKGHQHLCMHHTCYAVSILISVTCCSWMVGTQLDREGAQLNDNLEWTTRLVSELAKTVPDPQKCHSSSRPSILLVFLHSHSLAGLAIMLPSVSVWVNV